MNVEEMLSKYKLREPSADLKAKIALATKDEWGKPAIVLEFRRNLWPVAIGLAASFLIAFTGITVNSKLVSSSAYQNAVTSMEPSINTDPEMEIGAMARIRFSAVRRQHVDLGCIIKMNEILNEELNKGG